MSRSTKRVHRSVLNRRVVASAIVGVTFLFSVLAPAACHAAPKRVVEPERPTSRTPSEGSDKVAPSERDKLWRLYRNGRHDEVRSLALRTLAQLGEQDALHEMLRRGELVYKGPNANLLVPKEVAGDEATARTWLKENLSRLRWDPAKKRFFVEKPPLFTFVHITDSHCVTTTAKATSPPPKSRIQIGGYKFAWLDKPNSFQILADTVRHINKTVKPDFVIHTGDITDTGALDDMKKAKQVLDGLTCRYHPVMGDHDLGISRAKFEKNRALASYVNVFKNRCYSFDYKDWHFACLGIYPSGNELAWLKEDLAKNKKRKTILCTHRLVVADEFTVNLAKGYYGTELMMPRASEVEAVLKEAPHVAAVLSGHCHCNFHWKKHGIDFISTATLSGLPVQMRVFKVHKDRIDIELHTARSAADVKAGRWSFQPAATIKLCEAAQEP